MTRSFLDANFLLENDAARHLYHQHAANLPIIDYHNHLPPADIAGNRMFGNLTEAWLEGDHYKWRAMRTNGVGENYCTGNASPLEKFRKWAETVPFTIRNPLYHWTHLELRRYFDIHQLLDLRSADEIFNCASSMLQRDDFRVVSLLKKMKVELVCTTDDPADTLAFHQQAGVTEDGFKMLPTFRPDRVYAIADPKDYHQYLERLSAGRVPATYDGLLALLAGRIDFFHKTGCRVSDHGLENIVFVTDGATRAPSIYRKVLAGQPVDPDEAIAFRSAVLTELCRMYHEKGWVQQFHLGAMRNNNTRMMRKLGADAGFDSIGNYNQASLARFLDNLDSSNQLAKTILYNLNPADNALFATMAGNFNDGTVAGKIQYGSGWWFLDQQRGMEDQMNTLSNMGLLARFVGMVTDSRSFLSFPRHEYFRRVLCNLLGEDMERGLLPDDTAHAGHIVEAICYYNAKSYFGF